MRVGWVWTSGPAPVVTGQVPRASRYRGGHRVTDVHTMWWLLLGLWWQ